MMVAHDLQLEATKHNLPPRLNPAVPAPTPTNSARFGQAKTNQVSGFSLEGQAGDRHDRLLIRHDTAAQPQLEGDREHNGGDNDDNTSATDARTLPVFNHSQET